MNISFGSYKVRVEILVAIVVVFWIMFGHLLCSCCRMNLFEGFREGMTPEQRFKKTVGDLYKTVLGLTPDNDTQKKAKSNLLGVFKQISTAI